MADSKFEMTKEDVIYILTALKPPASRGDGRSTTHWLQSLALDYAISAVEREKKGKWIKLLNGNVECSECYVEQPIFSNYCPWCGAEMEVGI